MKETQSFSFKTIVTCKFGLGHQKRRPKHLDDVSPGGSNDGAVDLKVEMLEREVNKLKLAIFDIKHGKLNRCTLMLSKSFYCLQLKTQQLMIVFMFNCRTTAFKGSNVAYKH